MRFFRNVASALCLPSGTISTRFVPSVVSSPGIAEIDANGRKHRRIEDETETEGGKGMIRRERDTHTERKREKERQTVATKEKDAEVGETKDSGPENAAPRKSSLTCSCASFARVA